MSEIKKQEDHHTHVHIAHTQGSVSDITGNRLHPYQEMAIGWLLSGSGDPETVEDAFHEPWHLPLRRENYSVSMTVKKPTDSFIGLIFGREALLQIQNHRRTQMHAAYRHKTRHRTRKR